MMEMLKKIKAWLETKAMSASAYAMAELIGQLVSGVKPEDLALEDAEGDFPSLYLVKFHSGEEWRVEVETRGYPANVWLRVADDGTRVTAEFSTVSNHGVKFTVENGQLHAQADQGYSVRYWGDALRGDWAAEYREQRVRHEALGEKKPELRRFLLLAGRAATPGRAAHNLLNDVVEDRARQLAEGIDNGWEKELGDWRNELRKLAESVAGDMAGIHDVALTQNEIDDASEAAIAIVGKAVDERRAVERKAREAERRETPGTRAWRRQQRRMGLIA